MVIVGRDRNGKLDIDKDTKFMKFLYGNEFGRLIARILACPFISKVASLYLNSSLSNYMIKDFITKNNIDLNVYEGGEYKSFNEFFMRLRKHEYMHIDYNNESFISPCDGKLLVYKIGENSDFKIKNSCYTVSDLLNGDAISNDYKDGYILIFRLRPKDYHRYIYVDNGSKGRNVRIPGILHTVRPIALESEAVYKRNTREYTVLKTENFGEIVQIEVGAMFVGKISNYHNDWEFKRGEEKGHFEFGGSTIVMLVKKDKIIVDEDILRNTLEEVETLVECGMKIGRRKI